MYEICPQQGVDKVDMTSPTPHRCHSMHTNISSMDTLLSTHQSTSVKVRRTLLSLKGTIGLGYASVTEEESVSLACGCA